MANYPGTSGNDTIIGSTGNDTINGQGGDDTLSGGNGADIIDGGDGNDTVSAGSGADTVHGGDGNDTLNGLNDSDVLYGDDGNDTLNGGSADDILTGGLGNDFLVGGAGVDIANINADAASNIGTWSGTTLTLTTADGIDRITQVESLVFNNQTFRFVGNNAIAVLAADSATTDEGAAATGNVLANDIDIDGSMRLTGVSAGGPAVTPGVAVEGTFGTLTLLANGDYSYVPNDDAQGVDVFTYTVTDGVTVQTQTLTITVDNVNDAPVADAGSASGDEDRIIEGSVTAQDIDNDASELTYRLVDGPAYGQLTLNPDGSFSYLSDQDYFGADSFTFVANDGALDSEVQTVTLTVAAVNDNPVGEDATVSGDEDGVLTGTVSAADVDDLAGDLTFAVADGPANGVLVFNSDGTWTYTPDADFNGDDSFTYTVTDGSGATGGGTISLVVGALNDAPVGSDASFDLDEDGSLSDAVQAGDVDADGGLTYALEGDVSFGVLTFNDDGTFTYVPDENFNGTDSFTYTVTDLAGETSGGTVTLNVAPVSDAPIGEDDVAYGFEDEGVFVDVLANDHDGDFEDLLSITAVNGEALTEAGVTLYDENSVAIGLVTLSEGGLLFTPVANFAGTVDFTYTVSDGALDGAGSVSLIVDPINDLPVVVDASASVDEDNVLEGAVPAATDVEAEELVYSVGEGPMNGDLVFNPDGTFTYTPYENFSGEDSFTYFATDTEDSEPATFTITVNPVNDDPDAGALDVTTDEEMAVEGSLLDLFTDPDEADSFTFSVLSDPEHGTLVLDPETGAYIYTPNVNFYGEDSFRWSVTDAGDGSSSNLVRITVLPVNDAPILAAGETYMISEDATATGQASATDVEGDALTFVLEEGPEGLTFNPDGSWSFNGLLNPDVQALDLGQSLTLSFTYHAEDGETASDPTTVTFVISGALEVMTLTNGNDSFTGFSIGDEVFALSGDDLVNGAGGNDILHGAAGRDTLNGGAGDDILEGGDGDDVLNGGIGADLLTGGIGNDSYVVDLAGDVVVELDGQGTDTLTSSINLALTADQSIEIIVGSNAAGLTLSGNGFAQSITGGQGNDVLNGLGGADVLSGGGGSDLLDGGTGADAMTGGQGNDVFVIDDAGDTAIEAANGGVDTVQASVDATLAANIENLLLTGAAAINGVGNLLANTMTGNDAANTLDGGDGVDLLYGNGGSDRLIGGAGSDTLDGGAGLDVLIGGAGNDTYIVTDSGDLIEELAGEGTDTVQTSASYVLAANVDNLTLTGSAAINGTGNNLTNIMFGNGGDNLLSGMAGSDQIRAGAGADRLVGGTGNDQLWGEAGQDVFVVGNESVLLAGARELDTIRDFSLVEGDRIDLSLIDANTALAGDQAFTFVSAFTRSAGEATVTYSAASGVSQLRLDVNGDGAYDYQLNVNGDLTTGMPILTAGSASTSGGWLL